MSALTETALLLNEQLVLTLGARTVPDPRPGQARVRLEWAGVCGSDLHVLRTGDWVSQWPATLGHEIVGVVEECPGGELAAGTRVVVDSRMPCGDCRGCARSPHLCDSLRWVGEGMPGGFQRRAVFNIGQVVPCPAALESALAVLAEPLAVAMHAVTRAGAIPDRALIMGYGPVGALVHAELSRRRPDIEVTVAEPLAIRQQMAQAASADLLDVGDDQRWPLVVDAAGYRTSLPDAIERAEKGATILLVGLAHHEVGVVPQVITEHSLTIVGSNGFADELPQAIDALVRDPATFRWLITDSILLEEAVPRLAELLEIPAAGKVVVAL